MTPSGHPYDLDSNRLTETIVGGNTGNGSIAYAYNNDDQLTTETGTYTASSNNYSTSYIYDADGNLHTEIRTGSGATSNTYIYDLRNRMTSSITNGTTTTYTYDTSGVLASQSTAGSTTYYLNDPNNPTGYTKAVQQSTTLGGAPTLSYVLGNDIIAQSSSTNGVLYLLTDGHGSTRALVNSSGLVVSGQTFDYDAFGTALDFNATTAETTWLFGGDGFYDPSTGWTYQLARWRNGFWFTQMDSYAGTNSNPVSLHKYLYADANTINMVDSNGRDPNRSQATTASWLVNTAQQLEQQYPRDDQDQILDEMANLGFGDSQSPDYIYTQQIGWVDLQHFFNAASYTRYLGGGTISSLTVAFVGEGIEWVQLASNGLDFIRDLYGEPPLEGVASSAFNYEDLPSNEAGASFANLLQVGPSAPKLSEQLKLYFAAAGATDPMLAPNWSELPANEAEHEAQFQAARKQVVQDVGQAAQVGILIYWGIATLDALLGAV
jgi:YD repeat-containing protein